jgi:phage terminase Nu1 subunit (DNA packaging protein)
MILRMGGFAGAFGAGVPMVSRSQAGGQPVKKERPGGFLARWDSATAI